MTVDAFALWNIIRDVLDPQSEVSKLSQTLFSSHKRDPDERTPLSPKPNSGSLAPPLVTTIRNDDEDDWLDPEDQQKLEDEEERYEKEREERGDGPFNASNFGATGYTPSLTGITGLPSGKPPSILPPPLNHPPYHSTSEGQRHLIRKTGNISDFIRQCADIGPAYVQGVTMAATLKGETYSQFLQGVGQGPKGQKEQILENKGACFSCLVNCALRVINNLMLLCFLAVLLLQHLLLQLCQDQKLFALDIKKAFIGHQESGVGEIHLRLKRFHIDNSPRRKRGKTSWSPRRSSSPPRDPQLSLR